MRDFSAILENIENELAELKKINDELIKENDFLRMQLNMGSNKVVNNIVKCKNIKEMFEKIKTPALGYRSTSPAINLMLRAGYSNLEGITSIDVRDFEKNAGNNRGGAKTIALIIVTLEHFGIEVTGIESLLYRREERYAIKRAIREYRENLKFEQ